MPTVKQFEIRDGYQYDDSDGIKIERTIKFVDRRKSFFVYHAYLLEDPKSELYFVTFKGRKRLSEWTYHVEADDPGTALQMARAAFKNLARNKQEYVGKISTMRSWLRRTPGITFSKEDAQNAGFCRLGVENFFSELGWGEVVTAKQALERLNTEHENVCIVAYQVFNPPPKFI